MKTCLADVNVWLALLVPEHAHHSATFRWFETIDAGEAGLCRVVQLSILRLLSNKAVMSSGVLRVPDAWDLLARLAEDERVAFCLEPKGLDDTLKTMLAGTVSHTVVADAYLAAFAIRSEMELVTWDAGFQRFPGLRVKIFGGT